MEDGSHTVFCVVTVGRAAGTVPVITVMTEVGRIIPREAYALPDVTSQVTAITVQGDLDDPRSFLYPVRLKVLKDLGEVVTILVRVHLGFVRDPKDADPASPTPGQVVRRADIAERLPGPSGMVYEIFCRAWKSQSDFIAPAVDEPLVRIALVPPDQVKPICPARDQFRIDLLQNQPVVGGVQNEDLYLVGMTNNPAFRYLVHDLLLQLIPGPCTTFNEPKNLRVLKVRTWPRSVEERNEAGRRYQAELHGRSAMPAANRGLQKGEAIGSPVQGRS